MIVTTFMEMTVAGIVYILKKMIRMSGKTNIQVSRETKDYLTKLGRKGDTYDDIIRRLLAYYEITQVAEDE